MPRGTGAEKDRGISTWEGIDFSNGTGAKACKEGELGEHGRSMPFSSGHGASHPLATGIWRISEP